MRVLRALGVLFLLAGWTLATYADGGAVLFRQDAGAFIVTLFATSLPLHAGPADLSVMVQDKTTGDVLLDSTVDLTLASQTIRFQPNRLMQSATVNFAHAGRWRLALRVHRGNQSAELSTECTVEPGHSRARIVWFYVLLPVAIILLFLVYQALQHPERSKR
jgi:hypothetical protein